MLQSLSKLSKLRDGVKSWFRYSATILLARATVFAGILYAGLMAVDWNQMASLNLADGFSKAEMFEAAKWVGLGLITELARRRSL